MSKQSNNDNHSDETKDILSHEKTEQMLINLLQETLVTQKELSVSQSKSNDAIAEAMHETRRAHLLGMENLKSESKYNRQTSILVTAISFIIAISTIFIALSTDHSNKMQQASQAQITQEAQIVHDKQQSKILVREQLNSAISNMRYIREAGQMDCQSGKYQGDLKAFKKKQLSAEYRLVSAVYATDKVFNEEIKNKAIYFLDLIDKNQNICDINGPSEKKLQALQISLNKDMSILIGDDDKRRQELNNKFWHEK